MGLLHGLLLVFSLITVAPLMILFSMTIPTTPPAGASDDAVSLALEPLPTRQRRPQAPQEAPSHTRQLAPLPRPF
jgi:hypothetical protein